MNYKVIVYSCYLLLSHSLFGQTNFRIIPSDKKTYLKIIYQNQAEFTRLGFSENEYNSIGTNTVFFEYDEGNYFREIELLKGYVSDDSLAFYKTIFRPSELIETWSGTDGVVQADHVKRFCKLLLKIMPCDTSQYFYSLGEDWWISKHEVIDYEYDFHPYVREISKDKSEHCVLYAYRNNGWWHEDKQKRDYIAYLCGDRKTVSEWIYARNRDRFTHNGNVYHVWQQNSCETKRTILRRIIFICDLSLRYKQRLLTNDI